MTLTFYKEPQATINITLRRCSAHGTFNIHQDEYLLPLRLSRRPWPYHCSSAHTLLKIVSDRTSAMTIWWREWRVPSRQIKTSIRQCPPTAKSIFVMKLKSEAGEKLICRLCEIQLLKGQQKNRSARLL